VTRALVLGGAGQIGNAVTRALVTDGFDVSVVGRRPLPPANVAPLSIAYLAGDIDNAGQLDHWVAEHDVVVDAAAPYALNLFHRRSSAELDPSEHARRRTAALIASLRRHRRTLLYIGTLARPPEHTPSGPRWLRLGSRLQPYFRVKAIIESALQQAAAEGLSLMVIKPSACLGPWDVRPRFQCWVPAVLAGQVPLTLDHRVNVVDTRDVARAAVAALGARKLGDEIHVVGHNTTVRELFGLVCAVGGAAEPAWSIPAAYAVLPALWAELGSSLLDQPSALPSLVVMLLCQQQWLEVGATQRELGAAPRPLLDTVRDAIAWYRTMRYC
jgi:dihydroflavonol-4-reductase